MDEFELTVISDIDFSESMPCYRIRNTRDLSPNVYCVIGCDCCPCVHWNLITCDEKVKFQVSLML